MLSLLAGGGVNLKLAGGGPSTAGFCLRATVEKAGEKEVRPVAVVRREAVGRERASAVSARGDDIVCVGEGVRCGGVFERVVVVVRSRRASSMTNHRAAINHHSVF